MNNYIITSEYQISHAIQQAWQTKPAPTNEPATRELDTSKKPEYQVIETNYLENEVTRLEKRIKTLEDRLNYHINLLDGLAHSI